LEDEFGIVAGLAVIVPRDPDRDPDLNTRQSS
jgi:hypothetical protein